MGEFLEVMKQKKRMCEKYKDGGICQSIDYNSCPLKGHELCSKPITLINIDKIQEGEEIIMRWAAENPEPVYPTWEEYLEKLMALDMMCGLTDNHNNVENYIRKTQIPAELAQRLGLKPKEG